MLEQITQLVKQYGQDAVVANPDIPNDKNNEVMAEASSTITGGLQNLLSGGGLQDLISMFSGKTGTGTSGGASSLINNPAVAGMIQQFIGKLTGKFNLSQSQATQVSNNLIPNVMQDVVSKTQSDAPEHSSFNLNSLIGSLTGGKAVAGADGGGFDFQNLLQQFTGSGNATTTNTGSNQFDLQDIISKVTQQSKDHQGTQKEESTDGISNMIKGLFN